MRLLSLVDQGALRGVALCNPVACLGEDHLDAFQYESVCEIGGNGASSVQAFLYAKTQHGLGFTSYLICCVVAVFRAHFRTRSEGPYPFLCSENISVA